MFDITLLISLRCIGTYIAHVEIIDVLSIFQANAMKRSNTITTLQITSFSRAYPTINIDFLKKNTKIITKRTHFNYQIRQHNKSQALTYFVRGTIFSDQKKILTSLFKQIFLFFLNKLIFILFGLLYFDTCRQDMNKCQIEC